MFKITEKYPWPVDELTNSSNDDKLKGLYILTYKSQQSKEFSFFGMKGNILLFKNVTKSRIFSFGGL